MASEEVVEDKNFLEFFDQILENRKPGYASDDAIRESIQKFVDYFRTNRSAAGACAANRFSSNADFMGYFYWNSPISAAVTRNKALIAIRDCEEFRSCFNQKSLKVVSIGGGTGSDMVGLCSAIYKNSTFQDMFIHLIDNISVWKQYFNAVLKLLTAGDFGDASELIKSRQFSPAYICADMRKAMTPQCEKVLNEANLVWLKGFLSTLDNDSERYEVTEKIILLMTRGALLVVMESPAYDQFDDFVRRKLIRRVYSTDGGYILELNSAPKFRIIESTNQEIIIFERI